MHDKLLVLAERRQKLIQRAAEQRALFARQIQPLRKPLTIADRGLEFIRYVKETPLLIMGATAFLGVIRPLRFSKWFHAGWLAVKLSRIVRRWLN